MATDEEQDDLVGFLAEFSAKTNQRVHDELEAAGMRSGMMFQKACQRLSAPEYAAIFTPIEKGGTSPWDLIKNMDIGELHRFSYELDAMIRGAPKLLAIIKGAIMLRSMTSDDKDDFKVSIITKLPEDDNAS